MKFGDSKIEYRRRKLGKAILLCMAVLVCGMAISVKSYGATVDFSAKMIELQNKFPDGKYWNHAGLTEDNSDGYTDTACSLHKTTGVDHVYDKGGCTCNHFACTGHVSASQCMGFANKLGYDVFGDTTWTLHLNSGNACQEIAVGDIVRIGGSHSVFVTGKNGNVITVAEANYKPNCQISWGRTIDLTQVVITNYERADNYAVVLGDAPALPGTEQPATEATTEATTEAATQTGNDGFQKAKDGIHNCYYENGTMVKKQWIVVDGKDYYANEDGLILLSQWLYKGNTLVYVKADGSVARKELVKIGSNTYYFKANGKRSAGWKKYNGQYYYCDKKGIIQKKKWIIKGGKRYYVQKNGVRATGRTVKIKGSIYYFNGSGRMVKNKKITYNGVKYKANAWGQCRVIG